MKARGEAFHPWFFKALYLGVLVVMPDNLLFQPPAGEEREEEEER